MGDDCEKFGAWPGTYDLCYRDRWLERFFSALESSADWLTVATPGEYLAAHAPWGRADLPAVCYTEMMEWALPTAARDEFQRLTGEFTNRPDVLRFLRGGSWRGFFSKYPESSLLHKKMLHVSDNLHRLASRRMARNRRAQIGGALTHVLRAQCNDAYWHGIFGGLYAPHLRAAMWNELVRAETLAEGPSGRARKTRVQRVDFDADGMEDVYVTSRPLAALLRPVDGGTVAALDFRSAGITLINSLQRRVESYHRRLREASSGDQSRVVSIHDSVRSKEQGLERFLHYDRWARNAFRLLLFSREKTFNDYQNVCLDENATLAGGTYVLQEASPAGITLACDVPYPSTTSQDSLRCTKRFSFGSSGLAGQVGCEIELVSSPGASFATKIGLEIVFNLLAPDEPDRYFETSMGRHPLRWAASVLPSDVPDGNLRLVDEWQGVAITIEAPAATEFWIVPIETVSESEGGFERVYQGSQILIVWPAEFGGGSAWRGQAKVLLEPRPSPRGHAADHSPRLIGQ